MRVCVCVSVCVFVRVYVSICMRVFLCLHLINTLMINSLFEVCLRFM